jgi:hydroxypyruvate reductase
LEALANPANETLKPGDPLFRRSRYEVVASATGSLKAAAEVAETAGFEAVILGDAVEGEAREVAARQATLARELAGAGRRAIILSGGEVTVTVRGNGRGGPNQEFALAVALAIDGDARIAAVAADTDGTDGGSGEVTDPAGAFVDGSTVERARAHGRDALRDLQNNDSTSLFEALGDLLTPGPTLTNISDFRAILVDSTKG